MSPALIIAAIAAVEQLLEFIGKARTDLGQSGEMTPEQEKALDDRIAKLKEQPWWTEEP